MSPIDQLHRLLLADTVRQVKGTRKEEGSTSTGENRQMPKFSVGHFRMPGYFGGLSVGAGVLKMKIIAPSSASSWDVRSWRSCPSSWYVVAEYSALLKNVSAFEKSHIIYRIVKVLVYY